MADGDVEAAGDDVAEVEADVDAGPVEATGEADDELVGAVGPADVGAALGGTGLLGVFPGADGCALPPGVATLFGAVAGAATEGAEAVKALAAVPARGTTAVATSPPPGIAVVAPPDASCAPVAGANAAGLSESGEVAATSADLGCATGDPLIAPGAGCAGVSPSGRAAAEADCFAGDCP
ncbi:hypothetical protein [Streptacidiphilus sp. MAP12-16]|uniref:hypothetical protein n=1 Tax=Streptacidiphilus sp. MAP12-16 TaxID=3156300 RepID=UPI0035158771